MLKLKKIHILGFKSFCDRTELSLPGAGIAVVVGPNGCGKSNILDGVSWVLGEQSAKSLRGANMQDVIFAGTRDRKPLGMAEVTLTLADPETFEGPIPVEPELAVDGEDEQDWDEQQAREARAAEAEEIIASEQPGVAIEEAEAGESAGPQPVVLKIRRRKFHRTPQKGEIVITRRLFRTGESEYLLNGKLCRLRDIQDIFMGTGLGPESYAIIGQERIGQLLSSKPHDRRAIVEEAAGITRFKTKKRLAELRLESARQNLTRLDDIFEEVTRQMNSLKRQAAKAERFAAVRDELRTRLRVVLASRMAAMDGEQSRLDKEIEALSGRIGRSAAAIGELETSQHDLTEQGYELDRKGQQAQASASEAALELERATSREQANRERVADLEARIAGWAAELETAETQLKGIGEERDQQKSFLETAAGEAARFREQVEARQHQARAASEAVFAAERQAESSRRHAMQLLTLAGNARSHTAQAEESLAALDREASRLEAEMRQARIEQESLAIESSRVVEKHGAAAAALKRLESEIHTLREQSHAKRAGEDAERARANQVRGEQAAAAGRRDALAALIRNHSYSTDTVRQLLKPGALGHGLSPAGTLADFLEVGGEHESLVDEFLREELNYVVVESWNAAEQGVRLLKSGLDGRATFLIHPGHSEISLDGAGDSIAGPGVKPLRESIRVLNGLGRSLEALLPKLRFSFVVSGAAEARRLASQHRHAYFLTSDGECFHNATMTGGTTASEGPLALKRELRETETRLTALEATLSEAESKAAELAREAAELAAQSEARSSERREAETETANQGAALKQMEAEEQRVARRMQEWGAQGARNKDARELKLAAIDRHKSEAVRLGAEHAAAEAGLLELVAQQHLLRTSRDELQQDAARVTAELAGLEERRRGAEAGFQQIDRLHTDLERRAMQVKQSCAGAEAEREERLAENAGLAGRRDRLAETRSAALALAQEAASQAQALRQQLSAIEAELKTGRADLDRLREDRAACSSAAAKLRSDLEHLEASCLAEVNIEAAALRAGDGIERLYGEALALEEETCRGLRERLDQIGPVNMMALDEYRETAERHGFLESQRADLIASIDNTVETIKEIDQISRTKFDEAFARINENFAQVFSRLFQGGQAFLRLTDAENQAESGLDIVASPPGKKLQNVLLLSGGEKALTALALLVGIFQFQPSPFCVLDEVDAPLDETNVGRLADLLRTLSRDTQFLLVTHSKRMMQAADLIYGVTMQEPGVSKIVSVRLGNDQAQRATA